MPCTIKNPANIDLSELEGHVQDLYAHVHNKVGFNKPPTMVFDSEPSNEDNVLGKTAYYDPNTIQIHIYTDGRHPKDMLRSIAHELIHHWQNEEGRLDVGGYSGPGYYLKNKDLKNLEDEAMKLGNGYFREYEDNRKFKEKKEMSLNEWKNNELNRLLMKKFGILKEEKEYTHPHSNYHESSVEGSAGITDVDDDDSEDNDKTEDSDKTEKEHYDDDKMNDEEHIKAIEHHLAALKKDKNYDDDHEELEEGRNNPRPENKDKFVGHEDKYHNDRIHEADEIEDDLLTDEEEDVSTKDDSIGIKNESLKESIKRVLKSNKKLRLRFK
tara:strand:- start:252 stop:1229 length:978 start_codon:yes stop_codon:yes gene_type:complete